ncbi:hypothetical protein BaRGS_00014902 [Batillaria attramentaria]|uniref:Uncharacterized protein n=1 Tax=Batillaria attramentaria TaxID=370345 RepID=A0ABD0L3D8_9CAEN
METNEDYSKQLVRQEAIEVRVNQGQSLANARSICWPITGRFVAPGLKKHNWQLVVALLQACQQASLTVFARPLVSLVWAANVSKIKLDEQLLVT